MQNFINISVIIPVYNVEKYLDECLQSVVKQLNEDIEVIMVNDGSSDGSRKICEQYCDKYKNIFLVNQENQGLSAARNNGIVSAKGKYLLFLDADDFLTEDIFGEIKPILGDVDFLLGKKDVYLENTKRYVKSTKSYEELQENWDVHKIFQTLSQKNKFWFTASMFIIKREFLIKNNLYFQKGIYHEDELWGTLVFYKSQSMRIVDKSIYCYRVGRDGSIMNDLNIKRQFDRILIADKYTELIKSTEMVKEWREIFKSRRAALIWIVLQDFKYYNNSDKKKELYVKVKERVDYLKYQRYIIVLLGCRLLGLDNIGKLNGLRIAVMNVLCKWK